MTLTEELIEKAAKSAFFARYPQDPHPDAWDEIGAKNQARWHDVARAALEAVMPGEPVAWMVRLSEGQTTYLGMDVNEGYARDLAKHMGGHLIPLFAHPAPEPGELERLREAARKARAVLAQAVSAGWNAGGPTPEDTEAAFWSLDAALAGGGEDE